MLAAEQVTQNAAKAKEISDFRSQIPDLNLRAAKGAGESRPF
jgi:hypothetical protein